MEKITSNGIELVSWCWFNGRDAIGIVLGLDTITNEKKAYIGKVGGLNEGLDIANIMAWGSKFDVECAEKLISQRGFKI